MRKNSVKNTRVNSEVTKELSTIIRDLKDPRISPMASVVSAQVTPDLKFCKAYISVLGSEEELKDTIAGLKNASGGTPLCGRHLHRVWCPDDEDD